jgi:hypothetical protein
MRWAGNVADMEGKKCAYKVLVRKFEGKRQLGRPTGEPGQSNLLIYWHILTNLYRGNCHRDWGTLYKE